MDSIFWKNTRRNVCCIVLTKFSLRAPCRAVFCWFFSPRFAGFCKFCDIHLAILRCQVMSCPLNHRLGFYEMLQFEGNRIRKKRQEDHRTEKRHQRGGGTSERNRRIFSNRTDLRGLIVFIALSPKINRIFLQKANAYTSLHY